jgi:hypothetical protein
MIGTFPLCSSVFSNIQIVSALILDRASLFYVSPSRPTLEGALDRAYYQLKSSGTYYVVKVQFSLRPKQYSMKQVTEFVLSHRLR